MSVLGECYEIVDWKILGNRLGISMADLQRIKVDESCELLRQMTMLSKWISSGSASWRCLAEALLYPPLRAERVARAIADKHPNQ